MKIITGGKKTGNNLFYLFKEFYIPESRDFFLECEPEIENIFICVTGHKKSIIEGLLKASIKTNFFLLNPNGIIFSDKTLLNIDGSFTAATADQIEFSDCSFLKIKNNQDLLLSKSNPVKFIMNDANGDITINGCGNQVTENSTFSLINLEEERLSCLTEKTKTLTLIGNGINLNSGIINSKSQMHLISIESGAIDITDLENKVFCQNNAQIKYQNINLKRKSLIYIAPEKQGTINLVGMNININDGSLILSQNKKRCIE